MLRDRVVRVGDFLFRSMHVWLLRHGVIPIHILFCELGAAIGSAIAIAQRRMTIGCSALIFHGLLDYMDGGLQRTAKGLKISLPPYGSAHTVIDKFSDAILFAGFAIGGWVSWELAIGMVVAVSLLGLWGESKGYFRREQCLFDRADRICFLIFSLLLGRPQIGVVGNLLMGAVDFFQRLWFTFRVGRRKGGLA